MTTRLPQPPLDLPRRIYAAGLRAVYGRRGLPWRVHGISIRIDPAVRHLVPHDGETALYEFLRQTVHQGAVIVDVGAFLGVYAILEALWAGRSGRVIAIEPTAASAHAARRHVAFNGLTDRVRLVEAAASYACGDAMLHEYPLPYVNSLAEAADTPAPAHRRRVRVVTIDDLCRELNVRPSLIRMDVQGAEIHALQGARDTIRACGPALTIVAEMHPQCWPAFGLDESAVRTALDDLGLEARPLIPGTSPFGRDAHAVLGVKRTEVASA